MQRRRSPVLTLCLALLLGSSMACRSDDTGWRRVEAGEPELHQIGETWLRGVMSTRVAFEVAQRGLRFRADLGNPSSSTVTVELAGPGPPSRWELAAGEVRSVEAEVRPGGWTLGSPSPIVIASSRVGRPLPHPRTFVLVLVDTLRADHVRPDLMPRTLEFFADGHAFPDVTANASWTLPSVASMFTSRPVLEVTVPDGGILGIPAGMSSWGAWFSDAGFACGAVVANATIHALNGFAAGFDRYVVADPRAGGGSPDATWAIDHAGAWLASRDGEDALLYLHLMDPHEPYRAHRADAPPLPPLRPLAHRERTARPEETARFRARYAGEVAHVDDVLGPFLAELPERSTVLLTSDHGESLGEHGSWGHGLDLYQTAVAVPLLVVGPDVPPGVTDTPRQLLDVTPTLARLAGVDIPDEARGRPLFEDPGDEPIVAATFGAGPLRWALRTGARKVVIRTAPQEGTARPEWLEFEPLPTGAFLFDLGTDPREDHPTQVPEGLLQRTGSAFVGSVGRLVPGLQLLIWNEAGPTSATVELTGEVHLVQAWSSGTVTTEREGSRLYLRCETAEPFCAAAFGVPSEPPALRALGSRTWHGVTSGAEMTSADLGPPTELRSGAWTWWTPPRATVVGGHDETLERLRALGYIE